MIHGINVGNPEKSIGRLRPCFLEAGFKNVITEDYGFLPFGLAWARNNGIAEKMLPRIGEGDIIVAHSNGAVITKLLLEKGAKLSGVVLLDPALDRDTAMPAGVDWVHVYHAPGDMWVWIAKWIPNHPWGDQGMVGFTGSDPRYTNFSSGKKIPSLFVHSDFWDSDEATRWCSFVAKNTMDAFLAHQEKGAGS